MTVKIFVPLSREAALALSAFAEKERRDPKQQASWIIERELERVGLLPPVEVPALRAEQPVKIVVAGR